MNKKEAYEIKAKYGEDAYDIALEILEKDRIIGTWNDKKNVADHHINENNKKIWKLLVKLETVKRANN